MLSKLAAPGDTMVTSTASQSLLKVHAVRDTSGNLNVLIDNEDPSNSYAVSLAYNGFTPARDAHRVHARQQRHVDHVQRFGVREFGDRLAVLADRGPHPRQRRDRRDRAGRTGPARRVRPVLVHVVQHVGHRDAHLAGVEPPAPIRWRTTRCTRPGSGGSRHAGGYRPRPRRDPDRADDRDVLHLRRGGRGQPRQPVAAVSAGDVHRAAAVERSSCAVHYSVAGSWPGGFNGSMTMTNNGSTAINPWQLTFAFPASGEAVQGGWDGTWSQSGQQVTVNAASWNATIPANGGSVTIGFNGTDTGQDPAPTALYVNGTVCAND